MKKKSSSPAPTSNLPVSKQTAGGVAGAIIGGVIAGPVGAVAGAIAGTMMGNRAAKGKTLVSSETVKTASNAVEAIKKKLPSAKKNSSMLPLATKPGKSAPRKKPALKKPVAKQVPKTAATKNAATKRN